MDCANCMFYRVLRQTIHYIYPIKCMKMIEVYNVVMYIYNEPVLYFNHFFALTIY